MAEKTVTCYIAAAVVGGTAGVGFIIDEDIMTTENGKRLKPQSKEKLLKAAVDEFLRTFRFFEKEGLDGKIEIFVSPQDFETVKRLFPEDLKKYLGTRGYNPAVQVAAEFAIGER